MAERRIIKLRNKEVCPITHEECVVDNKATSISERFQTKGSITIPNEINALEKKVGFDSSSHSLTTQLNAIEGRYAEIVAELVEILQSLGVEPTSEDLDTILEEVKSYSASNVPKYSKFIRMTMIPTDVKYAGVTVVNGILRVIGGYISSSQKTNYSYSLSYNSRNTMTALPSSRHLINACYLQDGRIYIPGGFSTSGQKANFGYLIRSDAWSTRASLPEARFGYVAFPYNGDTMYVAGGHGFASIISYNCTQDAWTTLSVTLPRAFYSATCSLIGDKAYILGGINVNDDVLKTCYCFDCTTNTISTKTSLTAACYEGASAYIKGKIYLFGGSSSGNVSGTTNIYIYDPILNTWSTSSDILPVSMYGARAVSYNDDVAIIQYGRYVYLYRP